MALQEELREQGNLLFRHRSYLPLVFIIIFILTLISFGQELINTQTLHYNDTIIILAIITGLLGQFIRVLVAGFVPKNTSGRNTKEQKADTLNTTGMYSLCRNPLYLGNLLMMVAPVILLGNWLLILCFCLLFWLYYERIIYAEEFYLRSKFHQSYLEWAKTTPPLLPNFKNFKKPILNFSLIATIRREYNSFLGLCFSLFATHYLIVAYTLKDFKIPLNSMLTYLLGGYLILYIILRIIIKSTNLFRIRH